MTIKWVFFDLGWTLVDETAAHISRFERIQPFLKKMGAVKPVEALMSDCGASASRFSSSPYWGMLKTYGLSNEQLNEANIAAPYCKRDEVLYDGVPELLHQLSKSYRLGIIANQSEGTVNRLKAWEVRDYFSEVFASHEFGLSKPDPQIFQAALSVAKCDPQEAVMVGDRLDNDIGPANDIGWQTIRVLQGFSSYQIPRSPVEQATFQVPTVADVKKCL